MLFRVTPERQKHAKNISRFPEHTKPTESIHELLTWPCTSTNLVARSVLRNLSNIYDRAFQRKLLIAINC